MTTTLEPHPTMPDASDPPPPESPPDRSRWLPRPRDDDPAWAPYGLAALLVATACLYLIGLGRSGWANSFYAAAVEAGTKSWKAFFFGSFDSSNFITVDKPPASLWVMELSARLFGLNSWSVLVPEALEGVATVALCHASVRRWFGARAGLLAGAVVALTPAATLMFRFNNPDALLALLLMGAIYALLRALEDGRTRWLVLIGLLVGTGFITKMLQAMFVVPTVGLVYLLAGPPHLGRRIAQLAAGAVALVVAGGWWVAAVELTPAAERPYVGGSSDNNLLNLVFGYNGLGRLTGSEHGSTANQWGPTGWNRMFLSSFGGQISWLIPAAAILLLGASALSWRRGSRHDRLALAIFGSWFAVSDAILSFGKGIIHPYYTIALAAPLGGLVASAVAICWRRRRVLGARITLAGALVATATWAYVLLERTPAWFPWLRVLVLVLGFVLALGLVAAPRVAARAAALLATAALAVALASPAAYSVETAASPETGAIPSAGPGILGGSGPGAFAGNPPGARGRFGAGAGGANGHLAGGPPAADFGGGPRGQGVSAAFGGGGAGGLLNASTPTPALVRALEKDAGRYRWVVAVVGSNAAAGYELASDDPVMAIGGFNGTDPAPTLAEFESAVGAHEIHYFIASAGGGGLGGSGSNAAAITSWVESHFNSTTIGGETVYDLGS